MLVWITMMGCWSTEPAVEEPAADAPAEAEPGSKQKRGKGKGKGKGKGGKAGKAPPEAGACPEGVVANPGWPGEYPSPVVDVTRPVDVKGRNTPCQAEATDACRVPAGLYHPWSETKAEFVMVRGIERYKATKDTQLGEISLKAGDEVVLLGYLSEGYCSLEIGGKPVEEMCPGVGEDDGLEKVSGTDVPERQLVQVACEGGAKVWVDAADLMKADGVREGTILEFGKVGPGQ